MPIVHADILRNLIKRILLASGADNDNAERVAAGLVLSDLSGVDTHGVQQTPYYVKAIREGEICPYAKPEIVTSTPTTALVRGRWTFGFVSALMAVDLAIRKADQAGISVVSLVETHHTGRIGEYSEIAASRGMICLVWASGYGVEEPHAVPYGGKKKILHTHPISIGVPAGQEPSMVMDFATTVVAGGKVAVARRDGKQLPDGAIVDKYGKPTTDPEDFFDGGAHLPFGGHKGYSIMVANELLGRVFSTADIYADRAKGGVVFRHQGLTFIVFRPDLFQNMSNFVGNADSLLRNLRAVPPAPGHDEVMVPGDPESKARADRSVNGIYLNDVVWSSLTDLCVEMDIEVDLQSNTS